MVSVFFCLLPFHRRARFEQTHLAPAHTSIASFRYHGFANAHASPSEQVRGQLVKELPRTRRNLDELVAHSQTHGAQTLQCQPPPLEDQLLLFDALRSVEIQQRQPTCFRKKASRAFQEDLRTPGFSEFTTVFGSCTYDVYLWSTPGCMYLHHRSYQDVGTRSSRR